MWARGKIAPPPPPPMSSFSQYYWLICQILDSFYTLWISGLEESIIIMGIHADVVYIFAHLHTALRTESNMLEMNWLQEAKELVKLNTW